MSKSLVKNARLKTALVFATLGAALSVSAPALALTADQNTLITNGYTGAEASIGIVIGGLLGIGLLLCGFYVVYNLLKK